MRVVHNFLDAAKSRAPMMTNPIPLQTNASVLYSQSLKVSKQVRMPKHIEKVPSEANAHERITSAQLHAFLNTG